MALLLFGRKLYWLALGGLGFFFGLWLADHYLSMGPTGFELGIAVFVGILGACLTMAAQRLAVAFGGLFIGGSLAYWLAGTAGAQPPLLGGIAILGAMLAAAASAFLFEAALIALTSLIGAGLITGASHVGTQREAWLFLLLMCVGAMAQLGRSRRPRRRAGR